MSESGKVDQIAKLYIRWIPRAAIILLALVASAYIAPRIGLPLGTDPDKWGAFGDFFGGTLNPVFGVLTLFGLLITIWLQMETLAVQRKELAASTRELAKSTKALNIQNKTMLAQNFEGTFFQMLRRQTELASNISVGSKTGAEAIGYLLRRIANNVHDQESNYQAAYQDVYDKYNPSLGPYFRNLYHTLKLIKLNQHLTEEEKFNYSSLFRAQFSSSEIVLIFYNCLSQVGAGLKPLIIEYKMLKHIDKTWLAKPEWIDDDTLYPPETFSARD